MKKSKKFFIRICLSTGILASATLLTACFGTPAKHVKANYKVTAEAIPDYQSKNAPISSYWMPDKFLEWSAENALSTRRQFLSFCSDFDWMDLVYQEKFFW